MAVVDGKVKKGSLARVEPDGKVMRMWEAIETYMQSQAAADHHCRRRLRPGIVA
jgi:Holliday junction resolvase-like predicted endonuclease